MANFGIFRGFGEKLFEGELPTQLGLNSSDYFIGILDLFPNAGVAYSLRRLLATYFGPAIRVRRSSDNTEQDIGFVTVGLERSIDIIALTTFCGSGNGFVTTWYDQSGNNNNATQTTAANQPQIVSLGNVITDGVKNALLYDSTGNDNLNFTLISNVQSVFQIVKLNSIGSYTPFLGSPSNTDYHSGDSVYLEISYGALPAVVNGVNKLNNNIVNFNATPRNLNRNFISLIHLSNTARAGRLFLDRSFSGRSLQGYISEVIIYSTDQSSNRTGIETNINTFYNIY